MIYNQEEIGKTIKKERKRLGLSQEKLGEKIGTVGKQVSSYEKGNPAPPIMTMFKLCEVFDCELGYLLGEPEYSNRTKLSTTIEETTGLVPESISILKRITGTEKQCLYFGYESESFRKVLNHLISSDRFIPFIDALHDLELKTTEFDTLFDNLEKQIGSKRFNDAFALYDSPRDYLSDPKDSPLEDHQYQDILKVDQLIDKQRDLQYDIKVARYLLYEAFQDLLLDLYPRFV